ncbi:CDC27 family protein [Weissella ceti]|uniref:CDC27 family protein n=1 Tax=Weissella ceti TaxID=759620 RepID=A0ABT3E2P0_9LACO|nr:CDC27 family protein [Weissella ceti]MCW0952679.1 CDC27 family protein [Weissella ceti]QVK12381.1 hypothetical protein KHQ31_01765 [Weissella ceti]
MTNAMEKSISELVQLIEQDEKNWSAYVDLIGALVLANALPEAEELGLKSLTLFAETPEATQHLLYAVGNVYYAAGAYDRAQHFFDQITNPELHSDACLMQAQSLYGQKNYQKALAFALTYHEDKPEDIDGLVLLGRIWLALNDLATAKTLFDQALALNADDYAANFARGVVAVAMDKEPNNAWLTHAQALDAAQYKADAEQLDALLTAITGGI